MTTVSDDLPEKPEAAPRERLTSIDALRGFDMFWIVGGDWSRGRCANGGARREALRASASSSSTSNGKGSGSTT